MSGIDVLGFRNLVFLVALFPVQCFSETLVMNRDGGKYAVPVSIIQLRGEPEQYRGVLVAVEGVLSFAYDDVRLYLSFEDYHYARLANSVDIRPWKGSSERDVADVDEKLRPFHGKNVAVTGVFEFEPKYPFQAFSINEITTVELRKAVKRTPR